MTSTRQKENYVPMSVIKDIKAEIKSLMKEQETHFDVLEVGANRAFLRTLSIIDRHIREDLENEM